MRVSDALHTDNNIRNGRLTDVHTYRHITHRYTPAPPCLSSHVDRHDDEGRCHYPKRFSRRMPGTSPRPAWVQHMAPRRQPTTERSAGGRGGRKNCNGLVRCGTESDRDNGTWHGGGQECGAGVGRDVPASPDWESGSSSPRMSRSPPVSCARPWPA